MIKNNVMSNQSDSSQFAAYIPCYEGGNSVTVIKKNGETMLIEKSIKAVITGLLKERSIDIKYLKKNFYQDVGRANIMPIPLTLGTVLIPIKVRKPISVNDGSYGYIDLSCIEDAVEEEGTLIKLKCGIIIKCLETLRTVRHRMITGKLFEEKFASRMMWDSSLKSGLDDISSEYNKAATKRDITLLAYEIMKLRNRMESGTVSDHGTVNNSSPL